MYNFLKSNATAAFDIADKAAANAAGGVALWELPPKFSSAYNHIIFKRTRYMFLDDTNTNIVSLDDRYSVVTLGDLAASDVTVVLSLQGGGYATVVIPEGDGSVPYPAGATPISILHVTPQQDSRFFYIKSNNYVAEYDPRAINYNDNTLYPTAEPDTATLTLYKSDGSIGATLSAESHNGEIEFDVSPAVQTWFNADLANMDAIIVPDGRLFVQYVVNGLGGADWSQQFVAINAVAQVGESSNLTPYAGSVLTRFSHLSLFDGYELDFSLLSGDSIALDVGNTTPNTVSRIKVNGTMLQLLANDNTPILTDEGLPIYVLPQFSIPVHSRCLPSRPFYVRWVNSLGGVDYYMFGRRQEFSATVKGVSLAERYTPNTLTAKSNVYGYGMTTTNEVTVGAQGVPHNEYTALRAMPFSPSIEWYNEEQGKWLYVTIAKYDGAFDSAGNTHDFEVTFSLPAINTQY